MLKRNKSICVGCGAILFLSMSAQGATKGLEEVIVTAQKQEENVQDIPIAITAVTSDQLEAKGITDFKGILSDTPSILVQPYILSSTGSIVISMRGVVAEDSDDINGESAVGIYQDGFYIARGQGLTFDLADVERVEILRGPQGTLYGKNTIGGAINIINKKPSGLLGFKQKFTMGDRNYFRSMTVLNLPTWDNLSAKISFLKSEKGGFVNNPDDSLDFGEDRKRAGRFDLLWSPADDFSVDYFYQRGLSESTPLYIQNSNLRGQLIDVSYGRGSSYIYPDKRGRPSTAPRAFDLNLSAIRSLGHGLTLTKDINSHWSLKSLTGYFKLDTNTFTDLSDFPGLPIQIPRSLESSQFSQEFQIAGNLMDDRVNIVAGLYYLRDRSSLEDINYIDIGIGSPLLGLSNLSKVNNRSSAFYSQIKWTPPIADDKLDVIVGFRYNKDTRNGSRVDQIAETYSRYAQSNSKLSPALTLDYRISSDLNGYLKVSTGYKAGGSQLAAYDITQTVGPESITNYEIGMKSYWLNNALRLNVAAFTSKYKDKQYNVGQPDPIVPAIFRYSALNVGKTTFKGAEVELTAQPLDDLAFGINYAYIHAKLEDFPVIPGGPYDGAVLSNNSPYSVGDDISREFSSSLNPTHSVSSNLDYTPFHLDHSNISVHLDYRYQSRAEQIGPAVPGRNFASIPSYSVFNGRLAWAFDLENEHGSNMTVGLWVNNITDEEYPVFVLGGGGSGKSFAAVGETPGFTARSVAWGEPRSYGLDFSYEY